MLKDMLFVIPAKDHSRDRLKEVFAEHPEVKFVTLVGLDMGGNATDEKIPVDLFLEDFNKFMTQGVQTDGSTAARRRGLAGVLDDARSRTERQGPQEHLRGRHGV